MSRESKLTVSVSGGTPEERTAVSAFVAKQLQDVGVTTMVDWDTYSVPEKGPRLEDRTMGEVFYEQIVDVKNVTPPADDAFGAHASPRFGTDATFLDPAHRCTDAILENIRGRRGIGNSLEEFMHDDEIMDDFVQDISMIIRKGMPQ